MLQDYKVRVSLQKSCLFIDAHSSHSELPLQWYGYESDEDTWEPHGIGTMVAPSTMIPTSLFRQPGKKLRRATPKFLGLLGRGSGLRGGRGDHSITRMDW
jgi:hypothetical protein